jgi:hypothetical protein
VRALDISETDRAVVLGQQAEKLLATRAQSAAKVAAR